MNPQNGNEVTRRRFIGAAAGAAGLTATYPASASQARPGCLKFSCDAAVVDAYDVVVCGGGPSGCAAALAARREGLKVLLVEGHSQLGGMATSGLVSHWLGGRTQNGDWVVGGIFKTLVEESASRGFAKLPQLTEAKVSAARLAALVHPRHSAGSLRHGPFPGREAADGRNRPVAGNASDRCRGA